MEEITMEEIEELIEKEQLVEAQDALNAIKGKQRNAHWHFLQGKLYLAKKWYVEARKQFRLAVKNAEPEKQALYQAALQDLEDFSKTPEYEEYKKQRFANDCLNGCCRGTCLGCLGV